MQRDSDYGYDQYQGPYKPPGRIIFTRRVVHYHDAERARRPSGGASFWGSGRCIGFTIALIFILIVALVIALALLYGKGKKDDSKTTASGGSGMSTTSGPMGPQTMVNGPAVSGQTGLMTGMTPGPGETGGPGMTPGQGQTGSDLTAGPGMTLGPGMTPGQGVTGPAQTGPAQTAGPEMTPGFGITPGPGMTPGNDQTAGLGMTQGSGVTGRAQTAGPGMTPGPGQTGQAQTGSGQTGPAQTGPAQTGMTPVQGVTGSAASPGTEPINTAPSGPAMSTPPQNISVVIPDCPMDQPLVIHKRIDNSDYFSKSWAEMRAGFGDPSGNFWIGLEAMHQLTSTSKFRLLVDYNTTDGVLFNAVYNTFLISDEASMYTITITDFEGSFVTDAFGSYSGYKFAASDRPAGQNCAVTSGSSWWYPEDCGCEACLTQPNDNYQWKIGFTSTHLSSHTLSLECITTT